MKDFIKRLSSRKFLITLGLIVALTLFPELPIEIIVVALSYLGAEGLIDFVRAWRQASVDVAVQNTVQEKVKAGWGDEAIDQTTPGNKPIVPGSP